MKKVKAEYEKANPEMTVKLEPIQADENDYYTKLDLMNRSASTAPDVVYEDTFLVNSDISAGYLTPLDDYLNKWTDWSQFSRHGQDRRQGPGRQDLRRPDGHRHPRALVQQADLREGRPARPTGSRRRWNDILTAARTIKQKVPGVIPFNVYSGKAAGEGATMQGFEMLLYGTQRHPVRHAVEEVDRRRARASTTR